ncbi:MAG: sigma-70 family RNA polymerase sigma factor [Clostridia bacterium]
MKELFESLYEEYMKSVYSYFCVCFNRDIAEDLTQQVFIKLYRHLSNNHYFVPSSWRAWIFKITVNIKNDYLRSTMTAPVTEELFETTAVTTQNDEKSLQTITINNALNSLSKADKEILILKNAGFTSDEIGKIIGVGDSTARTRLSSARSRFAQALQSEGITVKDGV